MLGTKTDFYQLIMYTPLTEEVLVKGINLNERYSLITESIKRPGWILKFTLDGIYEKSDFENKMLFNNKEEYLKYYK